MLSGSSTELLKAVYILPYHVKFNVYHTSVLNIPNVCVVVGKGNDGNSKGVC